MRPPDTQWICYDLEFTEPDVCDVLQIPVEPIEIGAVAFDWETGKPGGQVFRKVVRPENTEGLTDHVLRLTGLTRNEVMAAPPFHRVWTAFASFTGKTRLASWTGADQRVLRNAYSLAQVTWPHHRNPADAMSFVMGVAASQGWRPKTYGLKTVCKYLGLPLPSHRAHEDALAVARILQALPRGTHTNAISRHSQPAEAGQD